MDGVLIDSESVYRKQLIDYLNDKGAVFTDSDLNAIAAVLPNIMMHSFIGCLEMRWEKKKCLRK